jgi:hypothetical protein
VQSAEVLVVLDQCFHLFLTVFEHGFLLSMG